MMIQICFPAAGYFDRNPGKSYNIENKTETDEEYMKFQYKISMVLCCILLATTSLISGIWYRYSKEMIVDNACETTGLLLKERDKKLTDLISTIRNQTRVLTYNSSVVDRYLNNRWENEYLNRQATEKMETLVTSIYISNPEIHSIEVGSYEGGSFARGQKLDEAFWAETARSQLKELGSDYTVIGRGGSEFHPEQLVLFQNVLYYGKVIGYCAVTLEKESMEVIFEDVFQQEAVISVETGDGKILYTSSNYEEYLNKEKVIENLGVQERELVRDSLGQEWLLTGNGPDSPFKMGVAVPMHILLGNMAKRFLNVILITVIMLCLLLGVVYALSRWIGRNVDCLAEAIQTFSQGRLDTEISLEGKDEFAKVSEAFNIMTQDIKKLMEDIKEKEKEKMTLEIRSLQGQINLHFLFNTLNMIKNLCHIQRVTNVEHLTDAFMQLLHISMEQDTEYISLKTELEYTKCYIEIYKYKSLYPIRYYMDIEPEIEDEQILKFMIQPIVENAIVHGLEERREDTEGLILIRAERDGEDLVITVMDNGQGFDTGKISMFNGIGLANTEKRIKLHYGEQYGITAESIEGVSTSITVRIPVRREEGND